MTRTITRRRPSLDGSVRGADGDRDSSALRGLADALGAGDAALRTVRSARAAI
jgi:hypothetical protein